MKGNQMLAVGMGLLFFGGSFLAGIVVSTQLFMAGAGIVAVLGLLLVVVGLTRIQSDLRQQIQVLTKDLNDTVNVTTDLVALVVEKGGSK
jgi:uncharacterized membrane protein